MEKKTENTGKEQEANVYERELKLLNATLNVRLEEARLKVLEENTNLLELIEIAKKKIDINHTQHHG